MRATITVLMTLLLASCTQQASDTAAAAPPQVRIAQVGSSTTPDVVSGTGSVAWRRESSLGFTSAGRIASMRVNEGDTVRPGQLLAALDSTSVMSAVSTARAERDRAAAEYTRSAKLLEQGWVTRPRVDTARAVLAAAEANVRTAQFQSRNAAIVAPGAGVVLARLSEPGQVVRQARRCWCSAKQAADACCACHCRNGTSRASRLAFPRQFRLVHRVKLLAKLSKLPGAPTRRRARLRSKSACPPTRGYARA